jgi:hypothetical protein
VKNIAQNVAQSIFCPNCYNAILKNFAQKIRDTSVISIKLTKVINGSMVEIWPNLVTLSVAPFYHFSCFGLSFIRY